MKKIEDSVLDKFGKTSHTKISSYIILGSILFSAIVFAGIEITNAIIMWKAGNVYTIPAAHITIFGMILGHHLFLLGIKKASENRQKKYDTQENVAKIENTSTNISMGDGEDTPEG
ncbi:MAG: hypothetical protein SLAVMIC_00614 [uncultured marine phage]|uniref:Uncharacterized protein n=1 Tax=uncultured marine phage TaxID=707152 RepID=A0A8D9FQD3_9VIRU|nr:MAG: hypothetical protein SLAVMIC_00614 [uncultured marine phage]